MATTYTANLKLRLRDDLSADARYNLERLDLLGGTFLVDTTDELRLRSRSDILLEPESAELSGAGTGGTVRVGTPSHKDGTLQVNALLQLVDTSSAFYLQLKYDSNSDTLGADSANRVLTVDPVGANRLLRLGGNFVTTGGDITLTATGTTNVTLPTTGTLATLAGAETLTNKTMDANANTFTNFTHGQEVDNPSSGVHGVTGSVVGTTDSQTLTNKTFDADANTLSNVDNGNIKTGAAIDRAKLASGSANHVLINDGSGVVSSEAHLATSRGGTGIASTAVFPSSGTIVTAAGAYTLTNKTIDADANTLTNVRNVNVASDAAIAGTKISPDFGSQVVQTSGQLRLTEGANYVGFQAPALASNTLWTLPNADGAANAVLATDGSGQLQWQNIAPAGGLTEDRMWLGDASNQPAEMDTTSGDIDADIINGLTVRPGLDVTVLADGSVSDTEFQYLAGVTSNIQTQLNSKIGTIGDTIIDATAGSVLFAGASGVLAQDNANLFWDDTNNRLGIGTATPSNSLTVSNASATLTGSLFTNTNATGTGRIALFSHAGLGRGVEISLSNAANTGAALRIDATHTGEAIRLSSSNGRAISVTNTGLSTGIFSNSTNVSSPASSIYGGVASTASASTGGVAGEVTGSGIGSGVLAIRNSAGTALTVATNLGAGVSISPSYAMSSGNNYTLTLPLVQGGANTSLKNNGSGVLSWTEYVEASLLGANNGVATLDGGGKIPAAQLPSTIMDYLGMWAASTNTPTLADGVGSAGDVYLASDAGTVDFGSGPIAFALGDWAVYSGTVWQHSSNANSVVSVNGFTGIVSLSLSDLTSKSHTALTDIGTNTHAQIDTHVASTSNPHSVTATQVGLGNVDNTSDSTKNSASVALTNKTIDGNSNTLTVLAGTQLSGQVPLANGGTAKSLTAVNGGVVWSDSDSLEITAAGTNGQVLKSGGAATPAWAWQESYASKTANYTITDTDGFSFISVDASGGDVTITLPALTNNVGRRITVTKREASTGVVSITAAGSDSIDGTTSVSLYSNDQSVTVIGTSTADNWAVVNYNKVTDYSVFGQSSTGLSNGSTTDIGTTLSIPAGTYRLYFGARATITYSVVPTSVNTIITIRDSADVAQANMVLATGAMTSTIYRGQAMSVEEITIPSAITAKITALISVTGGTVSSRDIALAFMRWERI